MQNDLVQLTCSQCGGNLIFDGDHYVCPSCGNTYERKYDLSNELVIALNRADTLRRKYFFDDALEEYDAILSETDSCVEAYWGAFLSEYGIEYVLDYDEKTYIPTCHRTSTRSVTDSKYYKGLTGDYKQKAKQIEEVRLAVLEEVKKANDYDVFICYKKKEVGSKSETPESKWARDLYESLTYKLGLKVFFADKSLSKGNVNWEPHIYSALQSSKLMVVLTSSLEHLDSAWVKNEWKRFNSFSNEDDSKVIRVIASNIDPYNLPRELQDKQVLDQNSGTWLDDITDIAEEIFKGTITEINRKTYGTVVYKKKSFTKKEIKKRDFSHISQGKVSASDESKLVLIENLISMRKFDSAVQACDQLIAESSGCARAYFLKFLANNNYATIDEFITSNSVIISFANFESAIALSETSEANEYLDFMIERAKYSPNIPVFEECISMPNITDRQVEDLSMHYYREAVKLKNKDLLDASLKTVSSDNVDTFIERNYNFALNLQKSKDFELAQEIYKKILDVDMGHLDTQWNYYLCQNKLIEGTPEFNNFFIEKTDFTDVETVLNYGYNPHIIDSFIGISLNAVTMAKSDDIVKKSDNLFYFAIGCVPENFDDSFVEYIDKYVYKLVSKGYFDIATKYVNQLFVLDPSLDIDYYYRLMIDRQYTKPIMFLKEETDLMEDTNFSNAINFFTDRYPKIPNIYLEMYKKLDWAKKNFNESDIEVIVGNCELDLLDVEYTLENFQNLCRSIVNSKHRHDERVKQAKLERKHLRRKQIEKVVKTSIMCLAVIVPIVLLYIFYLSPIFSNPVAIFQDKHMYQVIIIGLVIEVFLLYLIFISKWGFIRFVLILLALVPIACGIQLFYSVTAKVNNINNMVEFNAVSNCSFGNYKLTCDLDFTDTNWKVLNNFSGVLDGDGHTIKKVKVSGSKSVGLILNNSGVLKNIVFEDVTIRVTADSKYVGIVALDTESSYDSIIIKNLNIVDESDSDDDITIQYFGALVGLSKSSNISKVTVSGNRIELDCYKMGGVVGKAYQTNLSSVVSYVTIDSSLRGNSGDKDVVVGGLIGEADSNEGKFLEVKNSYYYGTNILEIIGKKVNDCRVVYDTNE